MPTVSEVMDEAARRCRVSPVPNNWVTSTTITGVLFRDFLKETIEELLDRVDWPDPITKDVTLTGTGVETYALPSDFRRLTRDQGAVYETTRTRRNAIPIPTNGMWTNLQQLGSAGGNRYYRLAGNEEDGFEISFFHDLETGATAIASYVSNNWLSIASVEGSEWSDTSAVLLLPANLVRRGVIWRFRQDKGLPYADRMNEYEAILARHANDKRGIRRIDMSGDASIRSPFDIPIPDYIPPA